jgi:hypothetical protein
VLTYRQKRALQAFRAFAQEVPLERAIVAARRSVHGLPESDWDDPELQGAMADFLAELQAAGKLPAHTFTCQVRGSQPD